MLELEGAEGVAIGVGMVSVSLVTPQSGDCSSPKKVEQAKKVKDGHLSQVICSAAAAVPVVTTTVLPSRPPGRLSPHDVIYLIENSTCICDECRCGI